MKTSSRSRSNLLARLLLLAVLVVGLGLLTSRTAAHAATTTITTCDEATLDSTITNAASGDTITFGCSGTISLTQTLVISKNLTLDGSQSPQGVTLDGQNQVEVLCVTGGVQFSINALTIAHGSDTFNSSCDGVNLGGGGLDNVGGTVSVSNSTFVNNSAFNNGGAIFNTGVLTISNSTFANNSTSGPGGALFAISSSTVNISNSTFANNSALAGGGGLYMDFATKGNIGGSIVANNTPDDCFSYLGFWTDQGYNLLTAGSNDTCDFTASTDLLQTDPKLAPNGLRENGGPTQTLALLDGSPAINQIPASSCPSADQRGIARPQGPACDIGAFEFRAPTLSLPKTITTSPTSSQGAVVNYTATASEPDDASATPTVSCSPASGSTFPIGTTTVNCTASDAASPADATSGSFQVVVNDTDLGLSNMPTNITADATSPQGAVVTYTPPTATDEKGDNPGPSVSCSPQSGSTFAIGTTTVTCTATDSDDTNSPVSQSFTVTVKGAAAQVNDLVSLVSSIHLSSSLQTALDAKLNAALKAINAGQTATACSNLSDFIGQVQAKTGKGITPSQASQLIAAARQVQAVLGC